MSLEISNGILQLTGFITISDQVQMTWHNAIRVNIKPFMMYAKTQRLYDQITKSYIFENPKPIDDGRSQEIASVSCNGKFLARLHHVNLKICWSEKGRLKRISSFQKDEGGISFVALKKKVMVWKIWEQIVSKPKN